MRFLRGGLTWIALGTVAFSSATVNRLVVFGDSLSDTGNVSNLTFGITPGASYWQGRFSNGRNWIDNFALFYGLVVSPSRLGGTNYAHGGALAGSGFSNFIVPNTNNQVSSYLNSNTPNLSTLFVVWAGGNNYLDGATNPSTVVSAITGNVMSLYNRGARKFFIPGLPLLGDVPRYIGTTNRTVMNDRSRLHNQTLVAEIQRLRRTYPAARFYYLDVATAMKRFQQNAAAYRFTNVTGTALVGSTVVSNPDSYLFFDDVHPTRVGHQWLSQFARDAVPEWPPYTTGGTYATVGKPNGPRR